MTTFTVTGHRGQTVTQLTWTDGELSGNEQAAEMVRRLAEAHESAYVPISGENIEEPREQPTRDTSTEEMDAASADVGAIGEAVSFVVYAGVSEARA